MAIDILEWMEYPETTANLLFAAADGEAYSAGMRGAVSLFAWLGKAWAYIGLSCGFGARL